MQVSFCALIRLVHFSLLSVERDSCIHSEKGKVLKKKEDKNEPNEQTFEPYNGTDRGFMAGWSEEGTDCIMGRSARLHPQSD